MKDLIVKLRKSAGLSQEALAKKLGLSRPTLVAIEKGDREITLTELKQISEIFDVPLGIILDEELTISKKIESQNSSKKSFQRFLNLVLLCVKYGAGEDGKITKTKLAKLVYLCDFACYYKFLTPLSGFEYRRLAQGPVLIEFFDLIDSSESLSVEKKDKAILISLIEEPDQSFFADEEQQLIRAICKKWKKANTQEIVDFTHRQIPWKVCREKEVIPYTLINLEEPNNVY